jgi:hypothetical protein
MLAAVLDPFDWSAHSQARSGENDLFRVQNELGTEAAADVGRDYAQLVLVKPQHGHQKGPHFMGKLGR